MMGEEGEGGEKSTCKTEQTKEHKGVQHDDVN